MRRSASEIIRNLERRVARLEKQSKKEPQWITWALEVLVESRETKAKSRSDLKVRRNGQVWEYHDRDDVILVHSEADRSDYIIYESGDVKTQMNEEIMDDILDNQPLSRVISEYPWAKEIIITSASLPYGDIEMWASEWAESQFEGMDDDEIIERADNAFGGYLDSLEEYEAGVEYWSPRMDPIDEKGMPNPLYSDRAEVMVFDYNNMLNDLPKTALNNLELKAEQEIKKALTQYPYEYLTDEMGWSEDQVLEAFGYLDEDERKSVIRQLGASEREFQYLAPSGRTLRTKLNYVIEEM